jgi:6-pyruvoyltetrahydropterin/6-carboxytetrahydropterin synthase
MTFEITQRFFFEAAHTLERDIEADASRRIHGHTYHAELTIAGERDTATGMVTDLGAIRRLVERAHGELDHRMLNELPGLEAPTLENLCVYLWDFFERAGCKPSRVVVRRDAMGDSCSLSARVR